MNKTIENVRTSHQDLSTVPNHGPNDDAEAVPQQIRSPRSPRAALLSADARNVLVVIASSLVVTTIAALWIALRFFYYWMHRAPDTGAIIGALTFSAAYGLYWLLPDMRLVRRVIARRLTKRAAKRYPGTPRTTIASALEGIVRIRGTGQLLGPAVTPGGILALAHRTKDHRTLSGEICVGDGSGMNAVICTEWVEIAGGVQFDTDLIVPDGATVEVTGHARRVPVPEASTGNFRRFPEVLEFTGTEETPVVIRVVDRTECEHRLAV